VVHAGSTNPLYATTGETPIQSKSGIKIINQISFVGAGVKSMGALLLIPNGTRAVIA